MSDRTVFLRGATGPGRIVAVDESGDYALGITNCVLDGGADAAVFMYGETGAMLMKVKSLGNSEYGFLI